MSKSAVPKVPSVSAGKPGIAPLPTQHEFERSVVMIEATSSNEDYEKPWRGTHTFDCSGSGFIIERNGKVYILTNAHVVEGARRVQVLLAVPPDERSQWRSILKPRGKMVLAKIVGVDRETDLAVLKI